MRTVFSACIRRFLSSTIIRQTQVRLLEKSITGDKVIALNETTLTGRLLIYLNSNKKNTDEKGCNDKEILNILKGSNIDVLKKTQTEKLCSYLSVLANRHYFNRAEFQSSLNILDTEYCRRLNQLKRVEIYKILHIYMNVISNRITETIFFTNALNKLSHNVEILPRSDLIELIFFVGLQKTRAKYDTALKKCLSKLIKLYLNDLTTEELCIICNSTFKTSTKIDNKLFLDKILSYLNDNLFLLKDPALFITFLKTLRHNRHCTEDLLATITCTIFFNKTLQFYSFSAICHILALYSDFLYYDDNLLAACTDRCLNLLQDSKLVSKREYFLDTIRIKDLKRLLWCLSNLNAKCLTPETIKNIIVPNILQRLELGDSIGDFASMVDIMLYLWMLDYRAYELVPYTLTKEKIRVIRENPFVDKSRLNLLLSCIQLEDPNLYQKINTQPQMKDYNMTFQLRKRPLLTKIIQNLEYIASQHSIQRFEVGCQISGINIIGITGFQDKMKKLVHIEVLDEYTCLKNTYDRPTGLMDLKLRFLNRTDEGVIVVNAKTCNPNDIEELKDILLDELDLVC